MNKDEKGDNKEQNSNGKNVRIIRPAFPNKRSWTRNPFVLILIVVIVSSIFARFLTLDSQVKDVDFGTFVERVKDNDFERIEVDNKSSTLFPKDEAEKRLQTTIPSMESFQSNLIEAGVIDITTKKIEFKQPSDVNFVSIFSSITLLIFIGVIAYSFFSAKNLASGGPMMGFGDSKAKMFITGKKQQVKFDQVKGADEAVDEVKEIVEFLKEPQKFLKLGARIPRGVLLVGPPGAGKTLLARAIAGEAEVPFFFTSGSEFEEMLVGTGASRVRDLFNKAKKASPAIIFIDEIDSIARKRGTVINSGNTEQTLNQILVEMDGFDVNTNVIIIAATNRPDVLDPAILRPGRFDRRVVLELPDYKGRFDILNVHAQNKPLNKDVNLDAVARRTIGFSGADLENTLNEAALIAAKAKKKEIFSADIEEAATKVTIGPAKKRAKSEKQKRIVAYHEAGHALAGYYTAGVDKVHRISIVSRGYTGGVTMYLPDEDDNELKSRSKFLGELIVLFGGRIAEKIEFNDFTTGASSDIKRATQIARDMVKKYGMSNLGYVDLESEEDFYTSQSPYSEKTAEQIDLEVRKLLEDASKECERILTQNKSKLDDLAALLIDKEVVEGDEFYNFMEGKTPDIESIGSVEVKKISFES